MIASRLIACTLILALITPCFAQAPKKKGASVPPAVIPENFVAKVVGVLDGDTIRVANAEISVVTLRLEGIDAPELKQSFGVEAHKFLHDWLINKSVSVQWKSRDKYDRLLAYVTIDNTLVNRALVEKGLAWQFVKYNKSEALRKIELTAREGRIGLWADESPIAPWDWRDGVRPEKKESAIASTEKASDLALLDRHEETKSKPAEQQSADEDVTVYLTKTGTHYHRAGCQHLRKSSIPIPLSRASGYTPCQHCNPPK